MGHGLRVYETVCDCVRGAKGQGGDTSWRQHGCRKMSPVRSQQSDTVGYPWVHS